MILITSELSFYIKMREHKQKWENEKERKTKEKILEQRRMKQ